MEAIRRDTGWQRRCWSEGLLAREKLWLSITELCVSWLPMKQLL